MGAHRLARGKADAWCEECNEYRVIVADGYLTRVIDDDGEFAEFIAETMAPGEEVCQMCGGKMSMEIPKNEVTENAISKL